MNMRLVTIVYAVMLIILGIAGYAATGGISITALIPTFFGFVIMILGLMAKNEKLKKHLLHGAALLALIGIVATAKSIPGFFDVITGTETERPAAIISQAIMAFMSIGYILAGLKSFLDARKS